MTARALSVGETEAQALDALAAAFVMLQAAPVPADVVRRGLDALDAVVRERCAGSSAWTAEREDASLWGGGARFAAESALTGDRFNVSTDARGTAWLATWQASAEAEPVTFGIRGDGASFVLHVAGGGTEAEVPLGVATVPQVFAAEPMLPAAPRLADLFPARPVARPAAPVRLDKPRAAAPERPAPAAPGTPRPAALPAAVPRSVDRRWLWIGAGAIGCLAVCACGLLLVIAAAWFANRSTGGDPFGLSG